MATKKITLNELRTLVKQIIKEETISEGMTIDKIKHYMDEHTFNYWTKGVANNPDLPYERKINLLKTAKMDLERELNDGTLSGVKYEAELNLINHLL
jgi:hypothetical protein